MLHNNTKSISDTVIPLGEVPVIGYSKGFFVVTNDTLNGLKPHKITVGIGATSVGSVTLQLYNKRSGIEASLLTASIVHDTAQPAGSYTSVQNVAVVAGDLIYARILNFTGSATGLTITVDFR